MLSKLFKCVMLKENFNEIVNILLVDFSKLLIDVNIPYCLNYIISTGFITRVRDQTSNPGPYYNTM